jgi:hypothetical protein
LSAISGCMEGNLLTFLWVERKEIRIPFAANFLDNSRNGIIWPNAIHGNIITWNCLEAMKKRREDMRR